MMRTKLAIFEIYIGLNNIENIYIANNTRKYGNIIVRKKKIYKNTFRFLFFFLCTSLSHQYTFKCQLNIFIEHL